MAREIKLSEKAARSIASLDIAIARRIKQYLDTRIANDENPRRFGKRLQGKLNQFWRYRVGNYRIICEIQDETVVVLVIDVGHRNKIYG